MYKNTSRNLSARSYNDAGKNQNSEIARIWNIPKKIKAAAKHKIVVKGTIMNVVNRGIIVQVHGYNCFCPIYEFPKEILDQIYELIRKNIPLKFLVTGCDNISVILSHNRALEMVKGT